MLKDDSPREPFSQSLGEGSGGQRGHSPIGYTLTRGA
jgi:hypothetical protein